MMELRNITKYYDNSDTPDKRLILDEISLKIEKGDALAITGPSGSGKSTLLNIMGTLDTTSSGNVFFNDTDISSFNEKELSKIRNQNIGFIFQRHYLLPQLNLIENVIIPVLPLNDKAKQKSACSRGMELLAGLGLADKVHRLPGQLSVGECQRAAVARALINKPDIILADEPTGSLDNTSAHRMGELLININKTYSVALVIVTHSIELAGNMKVIYNLLNGKLVLSA